MKQLIFWLEKKIRAHTLAFPLPRDPIRRKNVLELDRLIYFVLVSENKPTDRLTHLLLPTGRRTVTVKPQAGQQQSTGREPRFFPHCFHGT